MIRGIIKGILSFLAGSIVSILFTLFVIVPISLAKTAEKAGLGIIALGPVLIIIYSILAFFIGGILGVLVYIFLRRRAARKANSNK